MAADREAPRSRKRRDADVAFGGRVVLLPRHLHADVGILQVCIVRRVRSFDAGHHAPSLLVSVVAQVCVCRVHAGHVHDQHILSFDVG